MTSLRERQIREVLDEDLRAYREVLNREVKQAKIMNETYAPPNRFEKRVAFTIDQYFLKLQRHADDIVNSLVNGDYKETGVKDLLYSYQELIAYLDTYASFNAINQRDKAIIENKFDASKHLVNHVKGKIDVYKRYVEKLKLAKGNTINYKNYFDWVANNLIVNEDYNYIPSLCFKPFHTYYNELLKDWTFTKYGLLKPSQTIKPLFEFKK